ncbi:hypothetical protein PIB30_004661 [Stylosanthes scabra]|uniref:AP2/ERF domain-containing protein n=1 Tax=Stylosanthes scabra TaxID=79078 RepID=A0ABU6Q4Q8_9FABA|nr:hypothetical protein [Stylosanthes scabra]
MSSTYRNPPPPPPPPTRYRGTRLRGGKWVSEIRLPRSNKRIWLGTYPTPHMAAAAHDVATLALRGPGAHLNFPAFILSYPIPASFDDSDIRAAAVVAASLFAHQPSTITTPPPPPPIINTSNEQNTLIRAAAGEEEGMAMLGDYFDEDEVLNMLSVIEDMARGLQIRPPRMPSFDSDEQDYSDLYALW